MPLYCVAKMVSPLLPLHTTTLEWTTILSSQLDSTSPLLRQPSCSLHCAMRSLLPSMGTRCGCALLPKQSGPLCPSVVAIFLSISLPCTRLLPESTATYSRRNHASGCVMQHLEAWIVQAESDTIAHLLRVPHVIQSTCSPSTRTRVMWSSVTIGDYEMIRTVRMKDHKLTPMWVGPMRIIEGRSDAVFVVETLHKDRW